MAKDFVIYKVHIHKLNNEELYRLLDGMPKSIRGSYIRQALEHYAKANGLLGEKRNVVGAEGISFRRHLRSGLWRSTVIFVVGHLKPHGRLAALRGGIVRSKERTLTRRITLRGGKWLEGAIARTHLWPGLWKSLHAEGS